MMLFGINYVGTYHHFPLIHPKGTWRPGNEVVTFMGQINMSEIKMDKIVLFYSATVLLDQVLLVD